MKSVDQSFLDGHKAAVRKPVSITRLLQIALMAVTFCALIFSTTSAAHAAMGHHDGTVAVEAADAHPAMAHVTAMSVDCELSEQSNSPTDGGLNCCSAMCSAVFLVEGVANTTSDQQDAHFELPLRALTSHEAHGLLRPPSI